SREYSRRPYPNRFMADRSCRDCSHASVSGKIKNLSRPMQGFRKIRKNRNSPKEPCELAESFGPLGIQPRATWTFGRRPAGLMVIRNKWGMLLPLVVAFSGVLASGANFLGFNRGLFYGIVGTFSSPTVPTALQVL